MGFARRSKRLQNTHQIYPHLPNVVNKYKIWILEMNDEVGCPIIYVRTIRYGCAILSIETVAATMVRTPKFIHQLPRYLLR